MLILGLHYSPAEGSWCFSKLALEGKSKNVIFIYYWEKRWIITKYSFSLITTAYYSSTPGGGRTSIFYLHINENAAVSMISLFLIMTNKKKNFTLYIIIRILHTGPLKMLLNLNAFIITDLHIS